MRASAPIWILALVACDGAAPEASRLPRGSYIEVEHRAAALESRTSTSPAILYLNRCRGGCFVEPGPDDSRRGTSSIVAFPAHFPEFPGTDTTWNRMVRCVKELYLPFNVEVTDVDPGEAPHFMNIVAGRPELIGVSLDAGGVAPFACAPLENAISFTFAALYGEEWEALCVTAGQESGHAFGLDHELLCQDPMTYLPPCGKHYFRHADGHCGEDTPRECKCGQSFQSSYLQLLDWLGPRPGRLNLAPDVRIASPELRARAHPGFAVVVEATDDRVVDHVELRIEGRLIGTATASPYVFTAPIDLPLGTIRMRADAFDDEGASQYATEEVELAEAFPRPDATIVDVVSADRPEIIGLIDGGAPDADGPRSLDGGGCGCSDARGGVPGAALWLLLALAWASRRCRRGLLAVLTFGHFACSGGPETFGSTGGSVVFRPPPGTTLSFDPVILTRDRPPKLKVNATNVGDSPLAFRELSLSGAGSFAFEILDHPLALDPGKSRDIWLRFVPPGALEDVASATLLIPTTDPKLPRAEFPLLGSARAPCQLLVTPVRQGFRLGEERSVDVEAAGLSPCTITRIALDPELFPLVEPLELPHTLAPGERLSLRIRHAKRTSDPDVPTRRLTVFEADGTDATAELVGAPGIWDCVELDPVDSWFPDTDVGFETRQRVVMRNRCGGGDAPTVRSVGVGLGADSFRYDGPSGEILIPEGGAADLWLAYAPSGTYAEDFGQVHVLTDDAAHGHVIGAVHGRGRRSRVFAPSSVDLGAVPYQAGGCTSAVRRIPILNFGKARTRVEPPTLVGDPAFQLISVELGGQSLNPQQGFVLDPNGFAELRVAYAPGHPPAGADTARLGLRSTASNGELSVRLSGRSVAPGPAIDRFTVHAPKLDVLVSVDDSISALDLRRRLAQATPSWVAATAGAEQRLAVVRADLRWPAGGWPEQCSPFAPFLSTADLGPGAFAAAMSCLVSPSEDAPREVGALMAAQHFFEHSVAPPDPPESVNGAMGFLRDGARLIVLSASDDDDAGDEEPALLARFFRALVHPDRPDRAVAHDISVIDPAACDGPLPQRGLRYQAVSQATGGLSEEACAADLSAALGRLGRDAARPERVFSASRAITPGTLVVTLGGLPVIADAIDGYSVSYAAGTVELHGAAALAATPGVELVLSYAEDCHPL